MRTSRLQRRVGAITLPVFVMALAACGGSSTSQVAPLNGGNTLGPTTTLSAKDRQQKLLDFAACMRKNGVDMKDPTFDANGTMTNGGFSSSSGLDPRSAEFKAGMTACGSIVQGIGLGGGTSGNDSNRDHFDPVAMQAAMNTFTGCLRDHGLTQVKDVTFGRPDGDGHGPDGDGHGGQNGGGAGSGNGSGGAIFGGGNNAGNNTAGNGSTPPLGGVGGPPPGGSMPNGDGHGHGPDGDGFDPTARIIEHLNLDPNDATVKAALTACTPVLTNGLTTTTTTTG